MTAAHAAINSINALKPNTTLDEEESPAGTSPTTRAKRSIEDAILAYNSELKLEFKEKHRTKLLIPLQNRKLKDIQLLTSLQTFVLVSRKEVMKVKVSDMANNCSLLEITIEHEHDTANGAYNPLTIKNDLLNRIDHSGCGATEIISELVSSIPYTRIAVSKQNKKKS